MPHVQSGNGDRFRLSETLFFEGFILNEKKWFSFKEAKATP